jgi:hypothetical protein
MIPLGMSDILFPPSFLSLANISFPPFFPIQSVRPGLQRVRISSLIRPPLCSSVQCSWLQIQRSRVRFPASPDFLCSSASGTGSTQPL